jgi:tetratricopeptide (TPR) repeat protein
MNERDAEAWRRAGEALARAGRGEEADAAFERYFALRPGRRLTAEAAEQQRAGDLEGALALYREALTLDPKNVDAKRLMAVTLAKLGRHNEAEREAREAVGLAPDFPGAWTNFGIVMSESDNAEEALAAFRRALALNPLSADAHVACANAAFSLGGVRDAEQNYRRALALRPHFPGALLGLGHVLKTIGRQHEAIAAYRAAVAAKPDAGEAWWSLANLKTFRFSVEERGELRRLLEAPDVSEASRVNLSFALAKADEDSGDHDSAFAHYAAANAVQRRRVRYDPVQTEIANERIISIFDRAFFAKRPGHGCQDSAPIFIVGLPRSGSTLIEQILASHSDVDGTSELPALGRVVAEIGKFRSDSVSYPEAARDLSAADSVALGRAYLTRAARHRTGRRWFTDKMPNNFAHIGLIALILPHAKVIDARRHPMDSCWGTYKQLFARGQSFSYDLFELGHYYIQYDKLMRWWSEALPGRVLRVDYERLVLDQETETRRLLEHCGLPFEAACLTFHETARPVHTASSEQVRTPIYRGGLGAWRRVGPHLAGLRAQLADVIEALPADIREAAG